MDFENVVRNLNLKEFKDILAVDWDLSAAKNSWDIPVYLTKDFIFENGKLAELDEDSIETLVATADKIIANKDIVRLMRHEHYLLFEKKDKFVNGAEMPGLENLPENLGPTFNMLLALSGFPKGKEYFSKMGLPDDVARGSFKDLSLWLKHFKQTKGFVGLTPRILGWTCNLLGGSLYRLGRLQFNTKPFRGKLYAFRNKETNAVQAISAPDLVFNSSGQYDGIDGVYDKNAWTSVLTRDNSTVTGNPISPLGNAVKETMTLDLSEWEEQLAPGDSILDIHIPADGSMTIESCAEAFRRASEFFPKYFPEKTFKGFFCSSWFLDNQYDEILPESSNIVKYQREFYLFPTAVSGKESLWRVFGENGLKDGIEKAPRKSSMQKAVANFLEKGGRLRSGGAFFLIDDLPYGRQVYRKQAGA